MIKVRQFCFLKLLKFKKVKYTFFSLSFSTILAALQVCKRRRYNLISFCFSIIWIIVMKISVLNLLLLLLQLLLLQLLRLLLPSLLQLQLLHDAVSHPLHGHGAVQHPDHNAAVLHGDSHLVVVSLVAFVMDSLEYKYMTI